jgi:hypothetical protein
MNRRFVPASINPFLYASANLSARPAVLGRPLWGLGCSSVNVLMKQESQSVQSRIVYHLLRESMVVETLHYSNGEVSKNKLREIPLANQIERHLLSFCIGL